MAPAAGKDAAGQRSTAPTLFAEMWADIRHPNGLTAIQSDAELSLVKASIRIDYVPGVTATMWIEVEGTELVYDIKATLLDPTAARYIDLVCVQGARRA